jgi:hypothetical protein
MTSAFSNDFLSLSYITTDGQSASLSWNKTPIWGLRPHFYYCLTIAVFLYGAPSLTRERVCLLQCTIYNIFYCLRFETRSLYLCTPGTGWPGYTPRHWVKWLPNQLRVLWYLGANRIENTTSNSSSVTASICCRGNVLTEPLSSTGLFRVYSLLCKRVLIPRNQNVWQPLASNGDLSC